MSIPGFSQRPVSDLRVFIKGAGDLATGVALRLHRCGLAVFLSELERPLAVRRTVAFAQAVFDGSTHVEGVEARRCTLEEANHVLADGALPVLVTPSRDEIAALGVVVLVDAIMAKHNTGASIDDAPFVAALGPGFSAGVDCHAVIETNRGHNLGRVYWSGSAEPNTGLPGEIGPATRSDRVLRAPAQGYVTAAVAIGDTVQEGDLIARVGEGRGEDALLLAPFRGVLRGIIHPSVPVTRGMKIGDLDARAHREACFTVSDKSLAIGGGVLEAILSWQQS